MWEGATGELRATLEGHTDEVRGCAVSGDGGLVVTASEDGTARLWDAVTAQCLAIFHADGPLEGCAIHAESNLVVAVGAQGIYFLRWVR